jgi:hypothetical protein
MHDAERRVSERLKRWSARVCDVQIAVGLCGCDEMLSGATNASQRELYVLAHLACSIQRRRARACQLALDVTLGCKTKDRGKQSERERGHVGRSKPRLSI